MATYLDSSDEDDYTFELEQEADASKKSELFVNDEEGLKESLESIKEVEDGFLTRQVMTSLEEIGVEDVDDDIQRELAFYTQALNAAKGAISKFEEFGIKWLRPEDYYAEMVKSDEHMGKIKDQLMYEQKRIALVEERRKARDAKKYAKQVQSAKKQEKQKMKKEKTKKITELRQKRKRLGFGQEFDWDMALDEVDAAAPVSKKLRTPKKSPTAKSSKRMYKDAKYGRSGGFGPARARKRNSVESSGDMSSFKPRKVNRPGKSRRVAKRSKLSSYKV